MRLWPQFIAFATLGCGIIQIVGPVKDFNWEALVFTGSLQNCMILYDIGKYFREYFTRLKINNPALEEELHLQILKK